ncbi:STAS domain-containing protein [Mycobacterium deserti]|uniref:STAS domain-containing protein n=1 Tax=Mycobacterium deserti TaxID=2978347 RepID=A0ABT2MHK8_9MYCO|nr:STAS domain-containing protein [Mycobacterium deserti]MCT7660865.1 STAS domain-containing protein [Mycobacterium deserti]
MSTLSTSRPAPAGSLIERTDCHTAYFATRWLKPDTAVITAHGDLDAANSQQFVDYALRHAAQMKCLVLDLTGITFFGTAGFSALHTLNVRCAGETIQWALVPDGAVSRLLKICDPDSTLPICPSVESALATVQGEPQRLLKLVAESR